MKYNSNEDSVVFEIDGTQALSGKFSDYIVRTDAPVMTILLLKEPGSDPVDIDYVKVSDGTIDTSTTTAANTTSSNTTSAATGDMTAALVFLAAALTGSVIVMSRKRRWASK